MKTVLVADTLAACARVVSVRGDCFADGAGMIALRANPLDDILNARMLGFAMLGGDARRAVVSMSRD